MTICTERELLEALVDRIDLDDFGIKDSLVTKNARAFLAGTPACDAEKAVLVVALKECQQLAIDRIRTADEAVKKDIYAVDALMGIATISRRALADPSPAAAALLAQGEDGKRLLQKYGSHLVWCQARNNLIPGAGKTECDCGFYAAALAPGEETE
jgi:hypothetical protein